MKQKAALPKKKQTFPVNRKLVMHVIKSDEQSTEKLEEKWHNVLILTNHEG